MTSTPRNQLVSLAVRLERITIAWMVIEALGSIGAGAVAGSLLLIAFGIDSLIELASAFMLLWRLNLELKHQGSSAAVERAEERAGRIGGVLLGLLAAYVVFDAGYGLWSHQAADKSLVGTGIAVVAALGMPLLAKRKLAIAEAIQSAALKADAMESFTCGYMSRFLLLGLVANLVFGWWWLDSVAALAFVPLLIREAKEAYTGTCTCHSGEAVGV